MDDILLSVSNLSITIGKEEAVRSSSFSVSRGSVTALAGESGSGKSLTALAIAGLLPASATVSGSIVLDGSPLTAWEGIRGRKIVLMLQSASEALNPVYRIREQVRKVLSMNDRDLSDEHVMELLSSVGIADASEKYPHELSGGMQQRALLSMAMAAEPELLIADEITSSLDEDNADMMLRLLVRLASEHGSSVLFITHDLPLAARYAGRIAVMHAGTVVEEGDTGDVLSSPGHPYTKLLIRCSSLEKDSDGSLLVINGIMPSPRDRIRGCSFSSRCPVSIPACSSVSPPLRRSGGHLWRCIHE